MDVVQCGTFSAAVIAVCMAAIRAVSSSGEYFRRISMAAVGTDFRFQDGALTVLPGRCDSLELARK